MALIGSTPPNFSQFIFRDETISPSNETLTQMFDAANQYYQPEEIEKRKQEREDRQDEIEKEQQQILGELRSGCVEQQEFLQAEADRIREENTIVNDDGTIFISGIIDLPEIIDCEELSDEQLLELNPEEKEKYTELTEEFESLEEDTPFDTSPFYTPPDEFKIDEAAINGIKKILTQWSEHLLFNSSFITVFATIFIFGIPVPALPLNTIISPTIVIPGLIENKAREVYNTVIKPYNLQHKLFLDGQKEKADEYYSLESIEQRKKEREENREQRIEELETRISEVSGELNALREEQRQEIEQTVETTTTITEDGLILIDGGFNDQQDSTEADTDELKIDFCSEGNLNSIGELIDNKVDLSDSYKEYDYLIAESNKLSSGLVSLKNNLLSKTIKLKESLEERQDLQSTIITLNSDSSLVGISDILLNISQYSAFMRDSAVENLQDYSLALIDSFLTNYDFDALRNAFSYIDILNNSTKTQFRTSLEAEFSLSNGTLKEYIEIIIVNINTQTVNISLDINNASIDKAQLLKSIGALIPIINAILDTYSTKTDEGSQEIFQLVNSAEVQFDYLYNFYNNDIILTYRDLDNFIIEYDSINQRALSLSNSITEEIVDEVNSLKEEFVNLNDQFDDDRETITILEDYISESFPLLEQNDEQDQETIEFFDRQAEELENKRNEEREEEINKIETRIDELNTTIEELNSQPNDWEKEYKYSQIKSSFDILNSYANDINELINDAKQNNKELQEQIEQLESDIETINQENDNIVTNEDGLILINENQQSIIDKEVEINNLKDQLVDVPNELINMSDLEERLTIPCNSDIIALEEELEKLQNELENIDEDPPLELEADPFDEQRNGVRAIVIAAMQHLIDNGSVLVTLPGPPFFDTNIWVSSGLLNQGNVNATTDGIIKDMESKASASSVADYGRMIIDFFIRGMIPRLSRHVINYGTAVGSVSSHKVF